MLLQQFQPATSSSFLTASSKAAVAAAGCLIYFLMR
jgi:hypothetical protein